MMLKRFLTNWLTIAFIILAGVSVFVMRIWTQEEQESRKSPVAVVERQSFSVSVTERGIVRPARISPIKSQISSNQAKIVWLVKEGTAVRKDEVVARFDTKPFVDELSRAEQDVGDARATYAAAEKLLLMQEEEEQGKIEEAQRRVEIAQIDAQNITKGAGPLEREQVQQRLKKAERGYRLAEGNIGDMEVLLEKGHASLRERDKALDEFETAREQLHVAKEELRNFDNYKWPKMVREAELLVNGAESELQRAIVTAELQIQNRRAQVEKARRNVANREAVRDQAQRALDNCDIKAPTDGILLYSVLPRENGKRKIQIGDSVWVGQTFLEVPDTTELMVEVQIREIDVAKIRTGMETTVELDAFPGREFAGIVANVASLAEGNGKDENIRRFFALIRLFAPEEGVHVGMSATVKIIYQSIDNGLVIPVGAVVYREGSTFVYKRAGDEAVLTEVELGMRGVDRVQVIQGLQEGDFVTAAAY